MKRIFYYIIVIALCCFYLIFSFTTFSFAAYPKLITTITTAFETIESWLIAVATPAAAVAVRYRRFYEKI